MAQHALVGAWRVKIVGAPTPYHMFAFHSDGTMQQSNPPAGNKETSDTAGMGVWEVRGGKVKARFEEFRMSLADGTITRGVVEYTLQVTGDMFSGDSEFNVYDLENGARLVGPLTAPVEGQRVTFD